MEDPQDVTFCPECDTWVVVDPEGELISAPCFHADCPWGAQLDIEDDPNPLDFNE